MAFAARYPGRCADCGERFEEGTVVTYDGNDLVVVDCPGRRPTAPRPDPPQCMKCLLVHAGDCF